MKIFTMRVILKILVASAIAVITTVGLLFFVMESQQETKNLQGEIGNAPGKFVSLPDGNVHYTLEGADSLKLAVLITGGGITGMEVWSKTIPFLLSKGYRVLVYDLYGRGYSARPVSAVTPELLGKQLNGLLDSLKITAPFDIVAMSFGAIIALDFNDHHPDKVDKMILLDPTVTGEYKINKLLTLPVISPLVMTIYWYPRAVENQRKEFVNQTLFDQYTERLHYFMEFKGYKKMTLDTWNYVLNQNRLSLLGRIRPDKILVIYGDHDPYFPSGNIPLFESVYPTLKNTVIKEAGHMPQYEKSEEVNPLIADFLR
jgi:pimeloyl-ACP methyl ester carboxylesterase